MFGTQCNSNLESIKLKYPVFDGKSEIICKNNRAYFEIFICNCNIIL